MEKDPFMVEEMNDIPGLGGHEELIHENKEQHKSAVPEPFVIMDSGQDIDNKLVLKNTNEEEIPPFIWFLLSLGSIIPIVNIGLFSFLLLRKNTSKTLLNWSKGTLAFVIFQVLLYVIFIVMIITVWTSLDPASYGG